MGEHPLAWLESCDAIKKPRAPGSGHSGLSTTRLLTIDYAASSLRRRRHGLTSNSFFGQEVVDTILVILDCNLNCFRQVNSKDNDVENIFLRGLIEPNAEMPFLKRKQVRAITGDVFSHRLMSYLLRSADPFIADDHNSRASGSRFMKRRITRRSLLRTTTGALTAGAAVALATTVQAEAPAEDGDFKIHHRRIHQSVMGWCFQPMPPVELARHCSELGFEAIEGISPEHYPAARQLGLKISLISSHGFARGPFSRDNHEFCATTLKSSIDLAVANECSNVITFTGMREKGISDEQGAQNCVDCWKQVIDYAEEKQVNLCLEHLNTRDSSHPMKGHPGYFGDDVDFCVELIRRVDSPRMKLLFDIYHVQIMNGDVIRRIRQYKDVIAHYHTAGNPGRCELDESQEINYPAVMKAILATGYQGYVAQEFIPTWPDKVAALRHAAKVCDV